MAVRWAPAFAGDSDRGAGDSEGGAGIRRAGRVILAEGGLRGGFGGGRAGGSEGGGLVCVYFAEAAFSGGVGV